MSSLSLSLETLTFLTITTLVFVIVILISIVHLNIRLKKLLRGKNAKTLEGSLNGIRTDLDRLLENKKMIDQTLNNLDTRVRKSVQGIGTVRFNPFQGTSGSNQSFVTAFLNEKGDGVVFSSLYSRDRVSMFAKPVKENKSEYALTEEEQEAIKKAQQEMKHMVEQRA